VAATTTALTAAAVCSMMAALLLWVRGGGTARTHSAAPHLSIAVAAAAVFGAFRSWLSAAAVLAAGCLVLALTGRWMPWLHPVGLLTPATPSRPVWW
jgi:hypothetical protein